MCNGTIWSSFWPNPRIASSGRFCSGSTTLPNVLAAGRGRAIGSGAPTPQAATPLNIARRPTDNPAGAPLHHRVPAPLHRQLGEGDVAAAREHLRQVTAATLAAEVLD